MTDIDIPPAALEAGARFLFKDEYPEANITWDDLNAYEREAYRAQARAAFVAMVEAWPGMDTIMLPRMTKPGEFAPQDYIRLPLTENPDDKA